MRKEFLPFHQPWIGDEEKKEVLDTLDSGWITTGPKTKKFEEEFKGYIGSKFAIAVNSCTAGLHLSLVASGIKEGDEVITTPFTFSATANVIVHQRAKPVFVDIERGTFNISPEEIKKSITTKTKAIIPVHMAGHPCEMDEIMKIARDNNLIVIEDAAHALEAWYKKKKIGNISNLTAFSFYATKNITTAEGGMITTNNGKLADKIRILSLHGMSRDAWKRYAQEGSSYYEVEYPGYKYNMTDIQAALGLHQLKKINKFYELRERYYQMYNEGLTGLPGIVIPKEKDYIKHARHLYIVLLKTEELNLSRENFMQKLRGYNISSSIHFISLHLHPYYRKAFGFKKGDFPVAEDVSGRCLSLPLYPKMRETDVEYVIHSIRKIIRGKTC